MSDHDRELDQRIFARVTSALVECPQCGEIYDIRAGAWKTGQQRGGRKHQAGMFDPLTARFACDKCGLVAVVGIVMYLVDEGDRDPAPPRDWRAGLRQARRLVELARGRISGEGWRTRRVHRGANQVRKGGE